MDWEEIAEGLLARVNELKTIRDRMAEQSRNDQFKIGYWIRSYNLMRAKYLKAIASLKALQAQQS